MTRAHLALLLTLAAIAASAVTLLAVQAIAPRPATAGTSDTFLLRSIDRHLNAIEHGDLDRLHRDLSKLCRATSEQTYNCP